MVKFSTPANLWLLESMKQRDLIRRSIDRGGVRCNGCGSRSTFFCLMKRRRDRGHALYQHGRRVRKEFILHAHHARVCILPAK